MTDLDLLEIRRLAQRGQIQLTTYEVIDLLNKIDFLEEEFSRLAKHVECLESKDPRVAYLDWMSSISRECERTQEDIDWDNMAPVGDEFGSEEDA